MNLLRILFNQIGQVPSDGTVSETTQETGSQSEAGTQESTQEESFINVADLPNELKPHWKRMHGAYTKIRQEYADLKDKASHIDRFYSDPQFAQQLVGAWAAQNGYLLNKGGAQQTPQQPTASGKAPAHVIEAVKSNLAPELQWMAQSIADSQWAAQQAVLEPLYQSQQQERVAELEDEYEELSEALTEKVPGWEEHEDTMGELYDFLKSPALNSRKFGSKLELLYNMVTGNSAAIKEVTNRFSKAVKRTSSSSGLSRITSNVQDRVKKAKSLNDAFKIAADHAMNELGE